MTYQSTVRNQRSKGFKVKQALQFALILAICIWLLYQFKHSRDKKKDYGGSILSKLSEEHGSVILGRKGIAGWLSDGVESNLEEVNLTAEGENKEDGGGGDDELDRNAEEKAEEGSFHEENKYSHGNVATQEEKDDEKEPETQFKESESNEDNNSDIEVKEGDDALGSNKDIPEEEYSSKGHENSKGSVSDHDDQGDENDPEIQVSHDEQDDEKDPETKVSHNKQGDEDPETQVKESQNNEDITNTQIEDKDEAVGSYKENDEDKETTKSEEKIIRQPSGIENATDLDQSKLEGIHGFRDENGFPQDGMDLVESTPTVSSDDEANILRQETI